MTARPQPDVTELLLAWSNGDSSALEQLVPIVYQELRRLAKHYMRQERPGHTLEATALVNEAYLRLIDMNRIQWQNRAHFFAVAAQTMRRILVEFARRRHRDKRGGHGKRVTLEEAAGVSRDQEVDLVALNEALGVLATVDARMSQVVELRFFGGLSIEETGDVLKVSPETVMRDWRTAKAWLLQELSRSNKILGVFFVSLNLSGIC
jgi:RNA polymerase sigma factor (TIGR02999 family)